MRWRGFIFGAGGTALMLTSLLVLLVDDRTFLYVLRVLSSIELLIISVLMLIIAWKLLTLKPAPPAA
ncbi:MAG: hypothetical protein NZ992_03535 [Candidatus Korarchaeum sp.]|nr:hypothetical protein [Candidatus Korarchaeum sp.]MDW8035485.1 hypothetical protein [Candidatus Korarchaeum sp.]